jgi:DNA-binding CsgD family transcriptional regulator
LEVISNPAAPLVGRERELGVAAGLLAAACSGHGRLLVIEGPPATGKSRLLDEIAARADGCELLRASGARLERGFAFGLVRDLLQPWHDTVERELEGGDPGVVSRALVKLIATMTAVTPMLMLVDDVQWADEPSLRFLALLGSRLAELPALVVLGARPPRHGAAAVVELLGCPAERLELAGLTATTLAELSQQAERGLPVEVAREVRRRLAAAGPEASVLAEAVAVLGARARLRSVAELAGIRLERTAHLCDLLAASGLMASVAPPAFAAPVIGRAIYDSIAPGQRLLLHAAAATALTEAGAGDAEVADHLLRSEPAGNPDAAAVLRRAAADARLAGDLGHSAALLRRALDEPPPGPERGELLLELGVLEARIGQPAAERHLDESRRGSEPAPRGEAALELAGVRLLAGRYREAGEVLERELAGELATPPVGDLALRLRAERVACDAAAGVPPVEREWSDATHELAGATTGERALLAAAAGGTALAGEPGSVTVGLLARALGADALLRGGAPAAGTFIVALHSLALAGDLRASARRLELELVAARASGSVVGEAVVLALRSRSLLERGMLRAAEADARRALALSGAHGLRMLAPMALTSLLESLLDQGRVADAERELTASGARDQGPDDHFHCLLVCARGRLLAAAGEAHLGFRDLLAAGSRLLRAGCRTPSVDWRSRAGLLAHRLDRREEAAGLIEDELALAERLAAPRPLGLALRARALIAAPALQIELLGEAAELLRGTPAALDRARTLCDLGAALRRSGVRSRAREPLQESLQLAHECGALALAQRARHELIVLGARPRRHAFTGVDALTTRERQASELAAEGLTNREIAATMYVTPNTVEYHLTNAYRKLGIATREGLAAELASTVPT